MSPTEFDRLKKLMQMTQSGNDNEALVALRKANSILSRHKLNWEQFIERLQLPAQQPVIRFTQFGFPGSSIYFTQTG